MSTATATAVIQDSLTTETMPQLATHALRSQLETIYMGSLPKKGQRKAIDETLQRDLEHGWLFDYLVPLERMTWGRWDYWTRLQLERELPAEQIPQIEFCSHHSDSSHARKMLEQCLGAVSNSGSWMGWSGWENMDYFLDWLLFGFGHPGQQELPVEPQGCQGASMRLYQVFDLSPLLLRPYDHWADLLAESSHGKHNGFYPTPHPICAMMVQMIMGDGDQREKTVMEPAMGTGRMLLYASNHALQLYGMDIDRTVLRAALVNGYCYAPWMVRPIWWLDRAQHDMCEAAVSDEPEAREMAAAYAEKMSDEAVTVAPPHVQSGLFDTEFDAASLSKTAPLLRRKKKTASAVAAETQMSLLDT